MESLIECQAKIQKDPRNTELINEEVRLLQESIKLEAAKEQFSRQKSKIQWLRQGNQNTRYFHSAIKAKRNASRIISIKDSTGQVHTDIERIAKSFIEFYTDLLGDSKKGRYHVCSNLIQKGTIIQREQRDSLEAQFTEKEVKEALWSIEGDKSQGPDGYESQFFKDCWSVVRQDLVESVLDFFEAQQMLKIINNTVITLVPKSNNAEKVRDYRLIACYNTVYKVIFKLLCNRLEYWLQLLLRTRTILWKTEAQCRIFLYVKTWLNCIT